MKRIINSLLLIPLFLSAFYSQFVLSKTQTIELKAGWNLISLAVEPIDSSSKEVFENIEDAFVAVWGFDEINSDWKTFPQPLVGASEVSNLEVGKGYWVNVTRSSTLIIESTQELAFGQLDLYPGWNLVGFTTEQAVNYKNILSGVPYSQVWGFNTVANQFEGIVLTPGSDNPLREDFTQIEPGKAYWIFAEEQTQVGPELETILPSDIDSIPFIELGDFGVAVDWNGQIDDDDVDVGGDGYFDYSTTQRSVSLGDFLSSANLSILNKGTGVLSWNIKIVKPEESPWLKLETIDAVTGEVLLAVSNQGQQSQNTFNQRIVVNRSHLIARDYYAEIEITSNGSVGTATENELAEQSARRIKVHMNVPTIEGAYDVLVKIDTVTYGSGAGFVKDADLHNPRLYLSISLDEDGIKAIIDEGKTLLMPKRFYLSGNYLRTVDNEFAVSGSMVLPKRKFDEDGLLLNPSNQNPYQVDLRRDITLEGIRTTSRLLSPLDLEGKYTETIRNVLDQPILLTGTFTAIKQNNNEITTDTSLIIGFSGEIPDAPDEYIATVDVKSSYIISGINIKTNIAHPRPSDLIISLISPSGTIARLRENSDEELGIQKYNISSTSLDSLSIFNGELSFGKWALKIKDTVTGETGRLLAWDLQVSGNPVYNISGTLLGYPGNTMVLLSGCGISQLSELNSSGEYLFERLIDCPYTLAVLHPGYKLASIDVQLFGSDIEIAPEKLIATRITSTAPDFLITPPKGYAPTQIELTDITLLDSSNTYDYKWTLYKWVDGVSTIHSVIATGMPFFEYTLLEEGVYTVAMEIFNEGETTPIHQVKKHQYPIIIGKSQGDTTLPLDEQRIILSYTNQGGGGRIGTPKSNVSPFGIYQNDSATFDIDRLPFDANSPGHEDSNFFSGAEINGSNQIGETAKLDPAIGDKSYRIFVNMGQPIMGITRSGSYSLSIGANL